MKLAFSVASALVSSRCLVTEGAPAALVGNAEPREALFAAARGGNLHHAWLIAGPEGVGKGQFARQAALGLLAAASDAGGPADGGAVPEAHPTARLFARGSHPDYRILERLPKDPDKPGENVARSITIAQVRGLQAMFATKPALSPRRVIVIDAADDLERSAANALLKSLEEPPAGTMFLLISHAPGRLLPTIRSRCRRLRFEPLSDAQVESVVRAALPDAEDAEIAALVRAGQGAPGRALGYAGLNLAAIEADLDEIARDGDPANAVRVRLAHALGTKNAQPRYEAYLHRAPSFIAQAARGRSGESLRIALDAYREAQDLAGSALGLSLDPGATAFEMAGLVARLAPRQRAGA